MKSMSESEWLKICKKSVDGKIRRINVHRARESFVNKKTFFFAMQSISVPLKGKSWTCVHKAPSKLNIFLIRFAASDKITLNATDKQSMQLSRGELEMRFLYHLSLASDEKTNIKNL